MVFFECQLWSYFIVYTHISQDSLWKMQLLSNTKQQEEVQYKKYCITQFLNAKIFRS